MFLEGLGHFEARRFEAAQRCFAASLELLPGRVSTLVNLAATKLQLARPHEALTIADELIAREPGNVDAWLHRSTALAALGRHAQALAGFDRLLALDSRNAQAWLRRGQTLQELQRHDAALASYDRALALDAGLAVAWGNRGGILRETLRLDEAAQAFRQALACGADAQTSAYYLAAVGAGAAPGMAPAHYVESLFDAYAADFDAHLVGVLGYRAHVLLAGHLERLAPRRFRSALDLGCGTGLCGPLLRPLADRLIGIDLSVGMLDQARALGAYDRLVHADIVAALHGEPGMHDLAVAADVFIYIGDLAAVFGAVHAALRPGGVFCFSIETASRDDGAFELLPSLRYAHSTRYLGALAAQHGFEHIESIAQPIREEQRRRIEGLFVYLTRR